MTSTLCHLNAPLARPYLGELPHVSKSSGAGDANLWHLPRRDVKAEHSENPTFCDWRHKKDRLKQNRRPGLAEGSGIDRAGDLFASVGDETQGRRMLPCHQCTCQCCAAVDIQTLERAPAPAQRPGLPPTGTGCVRSSIVDVNSCIPTPSRCKGAALHQRKQPSLSRRGAEGAGAEAEPTDPTARARTCPCALWRKRARDARRMEPLAQHGSR